MKVAISQPTYLPWLGYFDIIDQVDIFVFLDSVQFEKRSWQQRNRIKTPDGLRWLTVPVMVSGRWTQKIHEVEIQDSDFGAKHLRSIESNYQRAPFFDRYFPEMKSILCGRSFGSRLAELNLELISWFCSRLGVKTRIVRSSQMTAEGARSKLLLGLCRQLDAGVYLTSLGAANYLLGDLALFSEAGITVSFQHFEHPEYRQLFPPFCPFASVLDLIFNEGENALSLIRSGRRAAFTPEEVAVSVTGNR